MSEMLSMALQGRLLHLAALVRSFGGGGHGRPLEFFQGEHNGHG